MLVGGLRPEIMQSALSERRFPRYNQWLAQVSESVRRHEVEDGGVISDRAQVELTPLMQALPLEAKDIEKLAAMREQTQFRMIARNITHGMRCQADEQRAAAADFLHANFALPD